MNKIFLGTSIVFFVVSSLNAQVGKDIEPVDVSYDKEVELPYEVNNAETEFFRPIHDQGRDGSCAQGSGLGYTFTYEVNSRKGITSKQLENQYPIYYTWNYLNEGDGVGTFSVDGWEIAKTGGIPLATYTDNSITSTVDGKKNYKKWYSGYDLYYNAMHNRVDWHGSIAIDSPEKLEIVKRWFYDRGTGSKAGGILNFSAGNDRRRDTLPEGTEEAGKQIIKEWRHSSEHAMTFVGYNDSVRFDLNGDGLFTNDIDITQDGIVDMKDWEIGALIVANTYGEDWADGGYSYMMYRLLAVDQPSEGGIGNRHRIFAMAPKEKYSPKLTFKTTLKHSNRYNMKLSAGISAKDKTEPEYEYIYRQFRNMGGALPLSGEKSDELEIGLDLTDLLKYTEPGKEYNFYLIMENDGGYGEVLSCSLIDYMGDKKGKEINMDGQIKFEEGVRGKQMMMLKHTVEYPEFELTLPQLPNAKIGSQYSVDCASSLEEDVEWENVFNYTEESINKKFPKEYTHILIPGSQDDGFAHQELEFDFPAYGQNFKKAFVSTNGYILFEKENPENFEPNVRINVFDADLAVRRKNGNTMKYYGNENFAVFKWDAGFSYNDKQVQIAVKLYRTGEIEYFYTDMSDSAYFISGITDGKGNSYVNKYTNTNSLPDEYAYKLTPQKYPTGLQLNKEGRLEGVPAEVIEEGTYQLHIRARNKEGYYAKKMIELTVE